MSRQGRRSGGLADGAKITNVPVEALHRSIVIAVATALRTGLPAVPLDGWAAYRSLSQLVLVNERRERIGRLEAELARLRQLARNCRDLAAEEPDAEAAAGYKDDVRRHSARAAELARDLDRQKLADDGAWLPPQFDGEVDYILAGMSTLLTPGGRVTKDERQALDKVFCNFSITPASDHVDWSLDLLLPADGRVLVLGPISGRVEVTGRMATPAEVSARSTSAGAPAARRDVIHALMKTGLPEALARSASMEPTGLLARVLLGEDVIWPGCPGTFDHQSFNQHVRNSWPTALKWSATVYAQTNPKRQALADVVAALGGSARMDQMLLFAEEYRFDGNAVYVMTLPYVGRGNTCWPPTVARTGTWSAGTGAWTSTMRNHECPVCHRPATAVVRVPEVPDAILCRTCRVMPSRPNLVFPPQYLDLALPTTVIPSAVLRRARDLTPGLVRKGPKPKDRRR